MCALSSSKRTVSAAVQRTDVDGERLKEDPAVGGRRGVRSENLYVAHPSAQHGPDCCSVGRGTKRILGVGRFLPEPRSQAGAETSLVFGGVLTGL
jgi:hypothetical protein